MSELRRVGIFSDIHANLHALQSVLEALDKSMQAVLDMLDPKAVAKFLAQRTASAGESTAAPAEVHEVDLDPTPGPVALSRGTPSPGVLGDRTPAPVLDTPGPEIADGLVTDKGPDFGQPLALGHCFDHINEGKFEAVVAYFKVYGDQDSESVFERLNRHADRGIPQALAVIGVLETLAKEKKQAGAIILREATHGYIPLGVFNVRENVRNAMQQPGTEFNSFGDALHHISPNYQLPISRFVQTGPLTKENLKTKQTTLSV